MEGRFEGGQDPEEAVASYVNGSVNKEGCKTLLNVLVYCNVVIYCLDYGA